MQRRSSLDSASMVRLAVIVLVGMFAAGCRHSVRDQAQVDPVVASVKGRGGWGQPIPILPFCKINDWVDRASGTNSVALSCDASTGPEATLQLKPLPSDTGDVSRRTQVQAELMTYADQSCDGHIAGIYSKNASTNFDLGFLTTLFAGGAAIASGRAATNLAAESALFSGTRSLVNSEIYYGYIGPAVMREIRSMRSDLREQIAAKRSCSINDYPPQEAINDALIYHDACSFATGLASLLSKAGDTTVGEDKLRGAQLEAMTARLAEKKKELEKYEGELVGLGVDQSARIAIVNDRIAVLRHEISSLEQVLVFAGVVDPGSAPDTAEPAANELAGAKNSVNAAQRQLDAASDDEARKAATASLDASTTRLKEAMQDYESGQRLDLEIGQLKMESATLSSRKQTLEVASARTNRSTAADTAELSRLAALLQTKQAEIARKETQKMSLASEVKEGMKSGIQKCAPVRAITSQ